MIPADKALLRVNGVEGMVEAMLGFDFPLRLASAPDLLNRLHPILKPGIFLSCHIF